MRCPACETENAPHLRECGQCGTKLPRRRRSADGAEDEETIDAARLSPFAAASSVRQNGKALLAFYFSLAGLLPFVGLVLGPVAFALGLLGRGYAKEHPAALGNGHALAGIVLGAAEFVFNAAGITLMLYALSQGT